MWDYDKLFAEGNIIGVNVKCKNVFNISSVDNENVYEWKLYYANDELKYQDNEHRDYESYIQYIIRIDEHGNVVERLFDRGRDMKPEPEPMPELKDGMFVKIHGCEDDEDILAFIYNGRVIYQDGEWDEICDIMNEDYNLILEVYSSETLCFKDCEECNLLWHSPNYQSN